jgi:hypothetical protein
MLGTEWFYTLGKPVIIEFLALRPPDRVTSRALHIRKGLERTNRWNGHISVQNGEQDQSVHFALMQIVNINASQQRSEAKYGDPCSLRP